MKGTIPYSPDEAPCCEIRLFGREDLKVRFCSVVLFVATVSSHKIHVLVKVEHGGLRKLLSIYLSWIPQQQNLPTIIPDSVPVHLGFLGVGAHLCAFQLLLLYSL